MNNPVALIVAPMPLFPTSAGNRKRLLATCELLEREGFILDFAYLAHEDQVYRRFGQEPPTDMAAMASRFRRLYRIEIGKPVKLKTRAHAFGLDDWYPAELTAFMKSYFAEVDDCGAVLVNYVFLSKCLESVPPDIVKIIDTHDRFGERKDQYAPSRTDPNFFYCSSEDEGVGLKRADIVIAIQDAERDHFRALIGREVYVLPPGLMVERPFEAPLKLRSIGFLGHGNDANLMSISAFADVWSRDWSPNLPTLKIAGEICNAIPREPRLGIQTLGFVDSLTEFYSSVDLVVAPMIMGTGLKLKVIEGLAFGKPTIGTALAFEGFASRSPDHALADPEAVAARVRELANDAPELNRLTSACEALYDAYSQTALRAGKELADTIRRRIVRSAATAPTTVQNLGARRVFTYGAVKIVEEIDLGAPAVFAERGATQIATEMRLANRGDDASLEAFSPRIKRWFFEPTLAETAAASSRSPLAGLKVTVAPVLFGGDVSRATLWGVRALAEARADWRSLGAILRQSGDDFVFDALWPTALIGSAVQRRVYVIPHAFAPVALAAAVETTPLFGSLRRQAEVLATCGDWPMAPVSVRLKGVPSGSCEAVAGLLVLAAGLLGFVSFIQRDALQ